MPSTTLETAPTEESLEQYYYEDYDHSHEPRPSKLARKVIRIVLEASYHVNLVNRYSSLFLTFTYCLVFIFDQFQPTKHLRTSFFVIQAFSAGLFLVQGVIQLFEEFPTLYRDVVTYTLGAWQGVNLAIVSANRFTALVYPQRYKALWTVKRSALVIGAAMAPCLASAAFKAWLQYTYRYRILTRVMMASSYIMFALAVACVLITVATAVISTKRTGQSVEAGEKFRIERKLLQMALLDNSMSFFYHLAFIVSLFYHAQLTSAVVTLVVYFSSFFVQGGSLLVLFLTSRQVRLAYSRTPPINYFKDLVLSLSKKVERQTSTGLSSITVAPTKVDNTRKQ